MRRVHGVTFPEKRRAGPAVVWESRGDLMLASVAPESVAAMCTKRKNNEEGRKAMQTKRGGGRDTHMADLRT